ncbi:MAG: hypothetical protein JOZ90_03140 [Alphaproteobacteria bacterium]|nr:hypothetical protein [Alphaproteobacteria bacterium]MBV9370558.1 hypothetical protein [Alphaproteobacteria bacterium]MBV9900074.1 hypothetical protein [Alphaproteobacteria bacterium]
MTVTKTLCSHGGCGLTSVSPGVSVYYEVSVNNVGNASAVVDIVDTLPPGFQLTGTTCGPPGGPYVPVTTGAPGTVPQQTVPANGIRVCQFAGYFAASSATGGNNSVKIYPAGTSTTPLATGTWNAALDLNGPLPTDLALTKTADKASVNLTGGSQIVKYTLTVENMGQSDLYLGSFFALQDEFALQPSSVALFTSLVTSTCVVVRLPANMTGPQSDCLAPVPTTPTMPRLVGSSAFTDFATWRFSTGSPGLLRVGDKIVITLWVKIMRAPEANCYILPGADGLIERAHIAMNLQPASGSAPPTALFDQNTANNQASLPLAVTTGATLQDPLCNAPYGTAPPVMLVGKTQILPSPSAIIPWAPVTTIRYQLRIKNVSTTPLTQIKISDIVQEGVGTPPFTATVVNQTCGTACTAAVVFPPQQLPGYGMRRTMFNATIGSIGAGATVAFEIRLRYSNPRCDSMPSVGVKLVHNWFRISQWTQSGTTVPAAFEVGATTRMRPVPACPLKVKKTAATPRTLFNFPNTFQVQFINPTPGTFTVGSLLDTARIVSSSVSPYAVALQVDYSYACSPTAGSVTGYPSVTGLQTAWMVETQLPQQGVRLIQNTGPVTFGPNSTLTCTVTTVVRPPPAGDPYCGSGRWDNSAILDLSANYDPNLQWPSGPPGMWATVGLPLPQCFNLVVNKIAGNSWTWQGGGPLSWTVKTTNRGDPIPAGAPLAFHDSFNAVVNVTGQATTCTPAVPACGLIGAADPPGPVTSWHFTPVAIDHGQTAQTVINVAGAPPLLAPPAQVCNTWEAELQFTMATLGAYYFKDPTTVKSTACTAVLDTGSLTVIKKVTNSTGAIVPSGTIFPISVNCLPYGPNVPANLADAGSITFQHIPAGSQCTLTETPPQPPGSPMCEPGAWATYFVPGPTNVVTIPGGGATATVTVENQLGCPGTATMIIRKATIFPPGSVPFSSVLVDVNCLPGPTTTTVPLPANGQISVPNLPTPSSCTLVEHLPPGTPGCNWSVSQNPPGAIAFPTNGLIKTVTLVNSWGCGVPTPPSLSPARPAPPAVRPPVPAGGGGQAGAGTTG